MQLKQYRGQWSKACILSEGQNYHGCKKWFRGGRKMSKYYGTLDPLKGYHKKTDMPCVSGINISWWGGNQGKNISEGLLVGGGDGGEILWFKFHGAYGTF